MKITRENYEAFFLDYHEGNLNQSQEGELMDFLVQNPDLKAELDSFELIYLEEDVHTQLENKEFLKKHRDDIPLHGITENQLISYHEGDLDEEARHKVLTAVAGDAELRRTFTLFGMTRLEPDMAVTFPSKSSLKHFTFGSTAFVIRRLAVAAAIIAFMVSIYLLLPQQGNSPAKVAENTTSVENRPQPADIVPESLPVHPDESEDIEETIPSQEAASRPVNDQNYLAAEPVIEPSPRSFNAVQLAEMSPIVRTNIEQQRLKPEAIDQRTDFYWFSYASGDNLYQEFEDELPSQSEETSRRVVSLTDLAYEGLEKSTGIDVRTIEGQLSERRFGLWDLAGIGLAGISQLTGTSLALEKETDEDGRITTLGIGEKFKIER
ncbi:MAG: hypothetical protein ACOCXV_02350 [Bacteroidota bacterium]